MPLRRTHRDMYLSAMGKQSFVFNQCRRLGISGREGRRYCATHRMSAALPKPERLKAKSDSDGPREPSVSSGMDRIPDEVLKSLLGKISE